MLTTLELKLPRGQCVRIIIHYIFYRNSRARYIFSHPITFGTPKLVCLRLIEPFSTSKRPQFMHTVTRQVFNQMDGFIA